MQLTQFTDFSLRVLIYLSQETHTQRIKISEIADQFNISHNHLTKIVNRLAKLGWIEATRGRNGGLKLAIAPETLPLGDLVRIIEGSTQLVDCEKSACILMPTCRLKGALDTALQAFYEHLNQYTLADMLPEATRQQVSALHSHYINALTE